MKLQDYIHYYIGCEVIVDGKDRKVMSGGIFVPNEVNQIYYNIEEDDGFSMPYNDDADDPDARVKPILRKLQDITDEEIKELIGYDRLTSLYVDVYFVRDINDIHVYYSIDTGGDWNHQMCHPISLVNFIPNTFNFLLKKWFDLFGLINLGLAIDSKTLK